MTQTTKETVAPVGAGATGVESLKQADSSVMVPHRFLSSPVMRSRMVEQLRLARLARPGERCRPARLGDVIADLGEFVGDGVARTAGGLGYEPLDWGDRIII